jgi:hypothetical protein
MGRPQTVKKRFRRTFAARRPPTLTISKILGWADAHWRRTGRWPTIEAGLIPATDGEKWRKMDNALRLGLRGLPGGSSLARLLAAKRNVRNVKGLPPLTIRQILAWADAYHTRHGTWPTGRSGPIPRSRGQTWTGVDVALHAGRRGLPGCSSLAQLLAEKRGFRNPKNPPPLSVEQILRWARAHRRRTGRSPTARSGIIPESRGETWQMVDGALRKARRGIKRGLPLYRLLSKAQNAHR